MCVLHATPAFPASQNVTQYSRITLNLRLQRSSNSSAPCQGGDADDPQDADNLHEPLRSCALDRKSTRLNSSHSQISYAVFCLKKTKTKLKVACINEAKHIKTKYA